MSLSERINDDLKQAMRSGDKLRLETLRSLRAAVLELERSGRAEVTDDDVLKAIMNQAKRRKEAAEQFRAGGRPELAAKEDAELVIIGEYLPKQMSDDEIRSEVLGIIGEVGAAGPADFKNVMPRAVATMRGRADGSRIQPIVKQELERMA